MRGEIHGSFWGIVITPILRKLQDPRPFVRSEGDALENGLEKAQVRLVVPNGRHDALIW